MSLPSPRIVALATLAVILLAGGWALLPSLASRAAPVLLYYPTGLPESRADPSAWGLPGAE